MTAAAPSVDGMQMKLEVASLPVTDVDRAKAFYVEQVGFVADHDQRVSDEVRFVQLTPPGSACSVVLGEGIVRMPPGTQELMVVVEDADAARAELAGRGVPVTEVDEQDWGRFVHFRDPDGNSWTLQQLPVR